MPKENTPFRMDGKRYVVDKCTNDMGMLTIELGAYRVGGGSDGKSPGNGILNG